MAAALGRTLLVSCALLRGASLAANVTAETTFYGAKGACVALRELGAGSTEQPPTSATTTHNFAYADNCPPGGDIAHPKIHKQVGLGVVRWSWAARD